MDCHASFHSARNDDLNKPCNDGWEVDCSLLCVPYGDDDTK